MNFYYKITINSVIQKEPKFNSYNDAVKYIISQCKNGVEKINNHYFYDKETNIEYGICIKGEL